MKVLTLNVALLALAVVDFVWLVVAVPVGFVERTLRSASDRLEVLRLQAQAVATQRALDRQVRAQARRDAAGRAGHSVHPWWGD
jgi:hypothetical protein